VIPPVDRASGPVPLDGTWERSGRNPLGAGVAGLLICGALYSVVGGLALSVVVLVMSPSLGVWVEGEGFVDLILSYYRVFQIPILAVTMAMELAVFLGLVVLLVSRWHSSRPLAHLAWRRPRPGDLALAGLGGVAVVPLAELLDRWSYVILPPLRELSGGEASLVSIQTPAQAVLVVAAVALTPGLCEETLFRGWLQSTLRRRLSLVPTLVIQAVLFSLFHLSPLSIVALAFVGVYLGWVFERCGSIFASVTAHALYNGTVILLVNTTPPAWLLAGPDTFSWPALCVSLLVLAAAVLGIERRSRARTATPPEAAA
jgi:membrane protease YdiL (CAAX protease family)